MAEGAQEVSGRNGPVGGLEPPLKRGGLPLPALKYWRKRRGISQAELARRAGLSSNYVFRVENGRRGCNPETARLLADLLGVELQDLRRKPDDALDAEPLPEPAHPLVAYLPVHQDYLRIILKGAVGSDSQVALPGLLPLRWRPRSNRGVSLLLRGPAR